MSYERVAIADTSAVIPSMPIQSMREDKIVDPYQTVKRQDAIGQPNISKETTAEPVKAEESVTLSPQMAALARREQKFRQQQLSAKAEREALDKDKAEIAELKALKEKITAGDYSDLEKVVEYDKYTQYLIDKNAKADPAQQEIQALKADVENVKKAHQDDVSKRYEAAVNERRTAVKNLVDTNPEFSSIKKLNMQDAVLQHILDTWENDSQELSPEQAAKEVSEILKEKAKTWSSILETEAVAQVADDKKQLPSLKQGIKTLTNNMTGSEMKRPVKSFQGMSDTERYAEARRRAEEKLQQRGK